MTFLKFVAIYVSLLVRFTRSSFVGRVRARALSSHPRPFDVLLLFRFDFSAGLVPLLSRFARLRATSVSLSFSGSCRPVVLQRFACISFCPPPCPFARPEGGSSFHPARRDGSVRAFITCRPSCRPFFLRPEDRARLLFHVLRVVLASFSKFVFIII